MNKNELIDAIAGGSGLSKADAGRALEAFLGSVQSTLASVVESFDCKNCSFSCLWQSTS